jgi:hypothetical protein
MSRRRQVTDKELARWGAGSGGGTLSVQQMSQNGIPAIVRRVVDRDDGMVI